MAGIPLFSPEYLSSPTAEGVVSHKTADMMAENGNLLSREIEVRSTKAEAMAKAPVLATAYADAYTRIATGDFGGFESLEKARAASVGNPFLMAMSQDASKEAGRLASSFMESQQLNARLAAQTASQEAIAQRQREDDWRTEDARLRLEDQKRRQTWEKDQVAKQRLAERMGTAYVPDPEPETLPRPARGAESPVNEKNTVTAGVNPRPNPRQVDTSEPLFGGEDPLPALGVPPKVSDQETERGFTGAGVAKEMTELPAEARPVSMQVQEQASQVSGQRPASQPRVVEGNKVEIQFGRMEVEVKVPKDAVKFDETIKTSTGAVTIKAKENANDEAKDAAKLVSNLADVQARDPVFSEWATVQLMEGKQVAVKKQKGENKVEFYQPYAVDKKGNEVPFGNKPDPATGAGSPRPVDKEVGDSWLTVKKLMETTLKGKVSLKPIYSEEAKSRGRQLAIQDVVAGKATLKEANEGLKLIGAELTQKEIDEIKAREKRQMAPAGYDPNKRSSIKMDVDDFRLGLAF